MKLPAKSDQAEPEVGEKLPVAEHPATELPKRRYNFPRIAWQLWSGGVVIWIGALIALMYLGTKTTSADVFSGKPMRHNWADRVGFFMIDHTLVAIGLGSAALALLGIVGEVIIRTRRRRFARGLDV